MEKEFELMDFEDFDDYVKELIDERERELDEMYYSYGA